MSWDAQSLAFPDHPITTHFDIGSLDRSPGDAVCRLFLARIAGMGREGVIKGLAINVLRMGRQVPLHRDGKIVVGSIGHDDLAHGLTI